MKRWSSHHSWKNPNCKDYTFSWAFQCSWCEVDAFSRACKVRQAFSHCLASMLMLCGISFVLAALAEWIFEMVLRIHPHFVELWLGITAFLLGMWGMEHVFAAPHSRTSQDGVSEEERAWRSPNHVPKHVHGKSFSKVFSNEGHSKRPTGQVFSSAEKADKQTERLGTMTESGKKPSQSEQLVAKVAATAPTTSKGKAAKNNPVICEVWAGNFEEEFAKMFDVAASSKYIAIDTEFPGFVLEGRSEVDDPIEIRNYAALRENVNALNIIQLGLAFTNDIDETGIDGQNFFCWQFNFKFNLYVDMCSQDSIQMLTAANVDWERHRREGISLVQFGDKLNASGLVRTIKSMRVNWISFQGGYDFAFMLKLLTLWRMPETLEGFLSDLDEYFPNRCDLKYQLQLPSGLSSLAAQYDVQRYGQPHQAGSDALLTCSCFFKLNRYIRNHAFDPAGHAGRRGALFGLVPDTIVSFVRGYNGARMVRGRREQHDVLHDSAKQNAYESTHAHNVAHDIWTQRRVVNTLLRLAHDRERVVANAANKALAIIQESAEDSDVLEHLRELDMADRIEAAQKQAIRRKMATHKWGNPKVGIPQNDHKSFAPHLIQYAMPKVGPRYPHYTMQASFDYSRYQEVRKVKQYYVPRQPYYWGQRWTAA